jgi:hypothetical protein
LPSIDRAQLANFNPLWTGSVVEDVLRRVPDRALDGGAERDPWKQFHHTEQPGFWIREWWSVPILKR